jgi:hypothetical protein
MRKCLKHFLLYFEGLTYSVILKSTSGPPRVIGGRKFKMAKGVK